jgi:hypothetical protein
MNSFIMLFKISLTNMEQCNVWVIQDVIINKMAFRFAVIILTLVYKDSLKLFIVCIGVWISNLQKLILVFNLNSFKLEFNVKIISILLDIIILDIMQYFYYS